MHHENLLLSIALIGLLGIGAQWLAWRFNLPAIVLMAAAGLIVGPGLGVLHPEQTFGDFYQPMISLAVAIILFEGGLQLKFSELRGLNRGIGQLVILGAPLAWFLGTLAGHYVAGLSWHTALLFAGIMIVTGPTVIMPLLRQAKLSTRPAALLKWEGIINDPIGALAAVIVFEFVRAQTGTEYTTAQTLMSLLVSSSLSVAWGFAIGRGLAQSFRRGWVPEFLKSPILLTAVLLAFVVANLVQKEGGLLAVTAMGITMANSRMRSINQLRHFKENIATLFIAGVFVVLTANLSREVIGQFSFRMAAFVVVMLLVVRPLSVLASTWRSGLTLNERLLAAWIAPRGIVAVAISGLFAVSLQNHPGFEDGDLMVPLAFAMVFSTVILHGFTIAPMGRILGLASTLPPGVVIVGASPWSVALAARIQEMDIPVLVADPSYSRLSRARQEGVPTYFGEILSEITEHHIEFSRYGYVLALSGNESHNALVCTDFAPEIGRSRTYQLSSRGENDSRQSVSATLQGQLLFGGNIGLDELMRRYWAGWTFQSTKLSDEYPPEQYRESLPEDALIIGVKRRGLMVFVGDSGKIDLQPSDRVIAYVPPSAPDSETEATDPGEDLPPEAEGQIGNA
ncbi:MAG: cation:proton antiporter [Parvularcula sp.]